MRNLILIVFSFSIYGPCNGQIALKAFSLKEIRFESIFGYDKSDSSNMFCILGQGFFRTPRSDNSDSIIDCWLQNHQEALVIPISSIGPTVTDDPNSKMTYCWLIDGIDTLNIFLVRQGCFPGGTMQRPKTWKELEKWEKELYNGTNKPDVKVYISEYIYKAFINQVIDAEKHAKLNKFGIWKEVKNTN
jgi:hypothetical protein